MADQYENFESLESLFTSQEEVDDPNADTGQEQLGDDGDSAEDLIEASGDAPADNEPAPPEPAGDGQDPEDGGTGEAGDDPAEPTGEPAEGEAAPFAELLQTAQELGLDVDGVQSEAELARRLSAQVESMQGEVRAAREQQQPPPQPPQPPADQQLEQQAQEEGWSQEKYFSEKYGGPTWKQEYDNAMRQGLVVEGESGYILAENAQRTPETDRIVGEMNAALQHRQHFYADLANGNFYEKTFDVYREPIEKLVEARVNEILSARESETQTLSFVDQFEKDNESWMYAKDPSTGQVQETPKRAEFVQQVREVQRAGVSDVETAIKLAMRGFDTGASAPPTEPPPAEKPPEPVGTGESIENNQDIQTDQNAQQQSFLDRARSASGHTPSASGRDAEDAPQVLSEGDLNSLWMQSYRSSRAQ